LVWTVPSLDIQRVVEKAGRKEGSKCDGARWKTREGCRIICGAQGKKRRNRNAGGGVGAGKEITAQF